MNASPKIKNKVFIAPLDWGLGHTTRCIPIIKAFQTKGYTIFIGCNERQQSVLQNELKDIQYIPLRGYNISYSKNKYLLPFKILMQIPKILRSILHEHQFLKQLIAQQRFDLVISDNRYGLFTSSIPCIFITHQLLIKMPFKLLEKCGQYINYRFINQFSQCWIPDDANAAISLSGTLSHPNRLPAIPVFYMGLLSRFHHPNQQNTSILYECCIALSGPEPQRTLLETKILAQIHQINGAVLLIRGLPNESTQLEVAENITVANHLTGVALQQAFLQSRVIICRSGYTTLMELAILKRPAIVVPTPGQTEQEYLAQYLHAQKIFTTVPQHQLQLSNQLLHQTQQNYIPNYLIFNEKMLEQCLSKLNLPN